MDHWIRVGDSEFMARDVCRVMVFADNMQKQRIQFCVPTSATDYSLTCLTAFSGEQAEEALQAWRAYRQRCQQEEEKRSQPEASSCCSGVYMEPPSTCPECSLEPRVFTISAGSQHFVFNEVTGCWNLVPAPSDPSSPKESAALCSAPVNPDRGNGSLAATVEPDSDYHIPFQTSSETLRRRTSRTSARWIRNLFRTPHPEQA